MDVCKLDLRTCLKLFDSGRGTSGTLLWTPSWIFGFHKVRGISWLAEELLSFLEGLHSLESVSCI
jgi:hypothetical protein